MAIPHPKGTLKRLVMTIEGDVMVVEIMEKLCILKPYRSKDPSAVVTLPWGLLYRYGLRLRAEEGKTSKHRKKRVKRGLL